MRRTVHNLIHRESSARHPPGGHASFVPPAALIVLLAMPGMAPAQGIPGLDPVKVKTIPIAPKGGAAPASVYTPGMQAPTAASQTSNLPAPVKVHTLRIDRDGHVLPEASADKPNP